MGIDEEGTLAAVRNIRGALVDPQIASHRGRIVRTMGDGLLVEFNSVVDAVRCAVAIQRAMPEHSVDMPADRRIRYRIAINMGDVVSDGDLIYGDGVTIASQMESLAEPGGVNVSRAVRDQVRDRLPISFEDTGEHEIAIVVENQFFGQFLMLERRGKNQIHFGARRSSDLIQLNGGNFQRFALGCLRRRDIGLRQI